METRYAAYGLRIASSFPLPGTEPATDGSDELPVLTLDLQEPSELERSWSGPIGPPEWRGRQGDGIELVIDRGRDGDLVFTYGERARFRLNAGMTLLDCAPRQSGVDWLRVLIGKVLPSISVMRGYEALHAAVIDFPAGVAAIMGPSGAGKSTLTLELLRRGRGLFADDQLTLGRADGALLGYPGTAHMNIAQSLPGVIDPEALGTTLAELAGERWFAASRACREPRPVAMLCLLERATTLALDVSALSPSPLLLAPFMLGLSTDAERQRSRFDLYADLMESAALVRLTGGLQHGPEQLADLVERAIASGPEMVVEAST
jgi:hypothetical protein